AEETGRREGQDVFSRRGMLGIALCTALVYAGFDWVQDNVEVVTMHISGKVDDYFPTLFIVDDPDDSSTVWVRAERPDRLWLDPLRENPRVVVHRGDSDIAYRAQVSDDDDERTQDAVDDLFRAKYGVLDSVAAWIWRRDAVPIRLVPPDRVAHDVAPDFAP